MLLRSHAGSCPPACSALQTGPGITPKGIPKACLQLGSWVEMSLLPWPGFCHGRWRQSQVAGYHMPARLTRDATVKGS